jgi:hypothetical protein
MGCKLGFAAILAVLPVAASMMDVSTRSEVALRPGDSLTFLISEKSYAANAPLNDAPGLPGMISFQFVSAENTQGDLSATLESLNGLISIPFPNPVADLPGTFSGSGYQGDITSFSSAIAMTQKLSGLIFAGSSALLVLRNDGPDKIALGLPPYNLLDDMYVTLYGGTMSVGALDLDVQLDVQVDRASAGRPLGAQFDSSPAPEPQSGLLFLAGGGLLCLISGGLKRLS